MRFLPLFLCFVFFVTPARAQSQRPDTRVIYKQVNDSTSLRMHLFNPERKEEKAPAIVFFFGGGWNGGSPRQFYPQASYLASKGMFAFVAEYRIKNKHQTTPFESVQDAMSAVRWVRQHAEEYGVDPDRIVASGGSAGGHLAAATAMLDSLDAPYEDLNISRVPNALVLYNPVVDNGPDGYGYERIGERYPIFSPFHNVDASTPPMTIFLGTEDRIIPVETMVAFQRNLQETGVRCDVHLYGGQPHGFFNLRDGDNPYYTDTLMAAEAFLRSLGYVE